METFVKAGLDETKTFLDIGSGYGKPCFHAFLATGAKAYGVRALLFLLLLLFGVVVALGYILVVAVIDVDVVLIFSAFAFVVADVVFFCY